jgi:hypothetical protein
MLMTSAYCGRSLVAVDPVSEVADTCVDRWEGWVAGCLTPRCGSNQGAATDEWATAVTTASADGVGRDTDVTAVDLSGGPARSASYVSDHLHSSLLKSNGQRTGGGGTAPSGDDAVLTGVVTSVGGSHGDGSQVSVG